MKSVIKATALPVLVLSAVCFVGLTGRAHAQGTQPKANTNTTTKPAATAQNYEFVAQDGDSMSVFARRALQLYDKDSSSVALTQPGTIFAETNVVMQSSPRLLDIGEHVTFPKTLVEQFATASTKLTADQNAAWQPYADNANFNLDTIKPVAAPGGTTSTSTTPTPNPSTKTTPPPASNKDQTNNQKSDDATKADTTKNTSTTAAAKTNKSAPWYWWLVGAGTLGVLYYILGERGKNRQQ